MVNTSSPSGVLGKEPGAHRLFFTCIFILYALHELTDYGGFDVVSEGTIRNRVAAMKNAGVLRITAIIDESPQAYRTEAMLGIKVASGFDPAVTAARLSEDGRQVRSVGRSDQQQRPGTVTRLSTHVHGQHDIASVEVTTGLKSFKNPFLLKSNWT